MIFVTVGTHEQGFDRLVKAVDELNLEDVFVQIGYSKYIPKNSNYERFLSSDKFEEYMKSADIIITHGGPSTFMKAISLGKTPIVVPRQKKYQEHVNDHQLEFCNQVLKKGYGIILVDDEKKILDSIHLVLESNNTFISTNKEFNERFRKELEDL